MDQEPWKSLTTNASTSADLPTPGGPATSTAHSRLSAIAAMAARVGKIAAATERALRTAPQRVCDRGRERRWAVGDGSRRSTTKRVLDGGGRRRPEAHLSGIGESSQASGRARQWPDDGGQLALVGPLCGGAP